MWLGFNSPRSKAVLGTWDRRFEAHQKNLKSILPKLNSGARRFFKNALALHDGTLTRMEVGDRISDADGKTTRDIPNRRQLVVRLFVLSDRVDQHCYTLEYKNIDKIELNYPGKIKLFPTGISNLGDWGYDELTSVAWVVQARNSVLFGCNHHHRFSASFRPSKTRQIAAKSRLTGLR
jgi:hypothetical protein